MIVIDWSQNSVVALGEGKWLHLTNPLIGSEDTIASMDYVIDKSKASYSSESSRVP